jgi:integrase
MSAKAIRVLRDRKVGFPEEGNERVKLVRALFSWAVEEGHVLTNPARDVPLIKTGSTGHHTWSAAEIERFEQHHDLGTKARLALALLLLTGVRRSDVVLLGKQHARGGWLRFTAYKNRNHTPVSVEIPVLPDLQRVIDASPTGELTFLVNEHDVLFPLPRSANGFESAAMKLGFHIARLMDCAKRAPLSPRRTAQLNFS